MGKVAGQRVTFASARIGGIAASLAAAATLLLPNAALASTQTIGSLLDPASVLGTVPCNNGSFDSVQIAPATYAVPPGGSLLTSWSFQASPRDTGAVGLEVWRPTTTANSFELVFISDPLVILTASTDLTVVPPVVNAVQVDVHPGDLIGLRLEGSVTCNYPTGSYDQIGFGTAGTPAPLGTELMSFFTGYRLNVAATVEVTVTPPPPAPPTPTSADQCKKDGWQDLNDSQGTAFKNQGDCVSFVATDGTNTAAGS